MTIFIFFTGHMLDCTLAKPQADQKGNNNNATVQNIQKSQLQPNYPPLLGYGMAPSPFGALGAFGASAYSQVRFVFFIFT